MALWSFPIWLYREAICLQCFPPTRYVKNGEYPSRMRTYYVDDLYPICSKQHCSEYACIVWLYHACSYTVGPEKAMNLDPLFEDIRTTFFFLLSWHGSLKKRMSPLPAFSSLPFSFSLFSLFLIHSQGYISVQLLNAYVLFTTPMLLITVVP